MEHYFTNNPDLKSEIKEIKYSLNNYDFVFKTDNGVFSKTRVDYASSFLVETFLKKYNREYESILDVGCGYGFIGISISKILNKHVDMVDINKRAIHLALMNIKDNKVDACAFESDIYDSVSKNYDLIITNPPIRAGKEVLYKFLEGGLKKLNKDGELYFVISKDQGAKSVYKNMQKIAHIEVLDKSKGFFVFLMKN